MCRGREGEHWRTRRQSQRLFLLFFFSFSFPPPPSPAITWKTRNICSRPEASNNDSDLRMISRFFTKSDLKIIGNSGRTLAVSPEQSTFLQNVSYMLQHCAHVLFGFKHKNNLVTVRTTSWFGLKCPKTSMKYGNAGFNCLEASSPAAPPPSHHPHLPESYFRTIFFTFTQEWPSRTRDRNITTTVFTFTVHPDVLECITASHHICRLQKLDINQPFWDDFTV